MAKPVRLDGLRARIRQRADMVNDPHVTDAELTTEINNSVAEFDDWLYSADASVNRKTATLSVLSGVTSYQLPSDFRALLGVDYQVLATTPLQWLTVRRCPYDERNAFTLRPLVVTPGVVPFRYYLEGDGTNMSIVFTPPPSGGSTVAVRYRPVYTTLVADADTVDGINGMDDYVVEDCCIKFRAKQEKDTRIFEQRKADLMARILAMAKDRDASEPEKISELGLTSGWDGGSGWN